MGKVIWVGGLLGQQALNVFSSDVGANEAAVMQAAKENGWAFEKAIYQTALDKTPTLSKMQSHVAAQLAYAVHKSKGSPILVVGSSVGFGVVAGALISLGNTTSPIALLGFKPVPDPLMAIELQINNPEAMAAIKAGVIPSIPMPVESVDGAKDHFALSAKHLNDARALRVLTHAHHTALFNDAINTPQTRHIVMMYGAEDHLTPSIHMKAFANSVTPSVELIELQGTHATDFTDALRTQTALLIARLG